ncbi:hypothetical protein DFP73DRAFT_293446 [Morchella snyderi]|nr:hypothetical protein DFP73DRAFT_293446 [Morchella snyderi]
MLTPFLFSFLSLAIFFARAMVLVELWSSLGECCSITGSFGYGEIWKDIDMRREVLVPLFTFEGMLPVTAKAGWGEYDLVMRCRVLNSLIWSRGGSLTFQ